MKELKQILHFVWPFYKPYKKIVIPFFITSFIYFLFTTVDALALGWLIDSMLYEKTVSSIVTCSIIFIVLNIISFALCYFVKINGQRTSDLTRAECKKQIARHIQDTSLNYSNKAGSSSFMNQLNNDAALIMIFSANSALQLLGKIAIFLITIVIVFCIDLVCGIAALVELPLVYLLYKIFRKKLLSISHEVAENRNLYFTRLFEMLRDIRHIKLNDLSDQTEERFTEQVRKGLDIDERETKLQFIYNYIQGNMDVLLKIFLFFYGGISVIRGNLSVGNFTIIYSYYTIITESFSYFLNFGSEVQENYAYYERLQKIVQTPAESNGTKELEQIHTITLKDVTFGYGEEKVLKNFSYQFERGKLYCIAGENGCGKSTMTMLLSGMYIDEFEGDIRYDDASIRELDMKAVRRKKMGICEQEPTLLVDTVRYNMTYNNDPSADEALMELAKQVSLDDFLKSTGKGLDLKLGESTSNLSGGQKQKIALVKAFYKNADVLVLDEPTSAMDAEGRKRMISYLQRIKKDKIILTVTHDVELMEAADEIVRVGA